MPLSGSTAESSNLSWHFHVQFKSYVSFFEARVVEILECRDVNRDIVRSEGVYSGQNQDPG